MSVNVITDWRLAVQAYLTTTFAEDQVDVRGGRATEINSRDTPLVLVHWPGWPELPSDAAFARPTLLIRWFPPRSYAPPEENPRDETDLEQAAADLMAAMEPMRKVGDFHPDIACRIVNVVTHASKTEWHIEATVRAFARNLASSAA